MLNSLLHPSPSSDLLLYLIFTLIFAMLALSINKLKQPVVLGQILIGALIGILAHYNVDKTKIWWQARIKVDGKYKHLGYYLM